MKRVLVVAMALVAAAAWGQAPTPMERADPKESDFEKQMHALDALIAKGYRVRPVEEAPPQPSKRKLGPIDKWRYESCRTDAAKAPTSHGVFAGMRVCREKFGQ